MKTTKAKISRSPKVDTGHVLRKEQVTVSVFLTETEIMSALESAARAKATRAGALAERDKGMGFSLDEYPEPVWTYFTMEGGES